MRAKLILAASLFIVFTFIVLGVVRASADDVDTHFETVRGELLAFYGSEIVAHVGILLGIIIAFPSVIGGVLKRLNNKMKRSWRAFFLYSSYFLVLIFIVFLTLYSVGRIVYYSSFVANLVAVTREKLNLYLHANITELNLTSIMGNLSSYARDAFWHNGASTEGFLAHTFYPTDCFFAGALGVLILSSFAMGAVWTRFREKIKLPKE